jgi:hypothetical protein
MDVILVLLIRDLIMYINEISPGDMTYELINHDYYFKNLSNITVIATTISEALRLVLLIGSV